MLPLQGCIEKMTHPLGTAIIILILWVEIQQTEER
jgi:hypothetical protein